MENPEIKLDQKEQGHKRSASYPGKNLEKILSFVTQIYVNFSSNTYVKREEWATIQKIHPNTLSRDFAAATQFGLMDKSVEGYKVSDLFIDIHKPENPAQKRAKLLIAFGTPKLYQVLIEKFDGHVIPNELPNTLIKHHSITDGAAKEAAQIFLESAEYVGAINDNKVIRFKDTLSAIQKTQYAEIIEETPNPKSNITNENKDIALLNPNDDGGLSNLDPEFKKVPIHLTKNKVAYFAYPANMSEKDVKLVSHQLEGILMRIQFENEEKEAKLKSSANTEL